MIAVPSDMPVTIPLPFTVATDVLLLLQMPPELASFKTVVAPRHIFVAPVIGLTEGIRLTVSGEVTLAAQPKIFVTL